MQKNLRSDELLSQFFNKVMRDSMLYILLDVKPLLLLWYYLLSNGNDYNIKAHT